MDWFLYNRELHLERVNGVNIITKNTIYCVATFPDLPLVIEKSDLTF